MAADYAPTPFPAWLSRVYIHNKLVNCRIPIDLRDLIGVRGRRVDLRD